MSHRREHHMHSLKLFGDNQGFIDDEGLRVEKCTQTSLRVSQWRSWSTNGHNDGDRRPSITHAKWRSVSFVYSAKWFLKQLRKYWPKRRNRNIDADPADTSDMIQSHLSWVPFSKSIFLYFVVKRTQCHTFPLMNDSHSTCQWRLVSVVKKKQKKKT